jgi:hypothetical protein
MALMRYQLPKHNSVLLRRSPCRMQFLGLSLQIRAPQSEFLSQSPLIQQLYKPGQYTSHHFPCPNFAFIITQYNDLVKPLQPHHAKRVHAPMSRPTNPIHLTQVCRERRILQYLWCKVRCRRSRRANVCHPQGRVVHAVGLVCIHDNVESHDAADVHVTQVTGVIGRRRLRFDAR